MRYDFITIIKLVAATFLPVVLSVALYLAEKHKKDGFSPIYIGDSSVDMQTAANAGFDACGVLWGFRDRAELEQFRPRFLVENAEELRKIILSE